MSGADVFTMEPEQVHLAVEELFTVEAEVDRLSDELHTECENTATALIAGQCEIGEALRTAADLDRYPGRDSADISARPDW